MTEKLTPDVLAELLDHHGEPAVSLYMPTRRAGRDVRENGIRFKTLMRRAQEKLSRLDDAPRALRQQVVAATELSEQDDFWQHQLDGLAMFLIGERMRFFQVVSSLPEEVHVREELILTPLLPYIQDDGVFYVVAVSEKGTRLLRGTREGIEELEEARLPESMVAVTGTKTFKGFAMHSFRVRMRQDNRGVPHGHPDADDEEERRMYFRAIDEAVRDVVKDPRAPLIFAGTQEQFALFKEESEHPGLMEEILHGNHEKTLKEELHQAAWQLVKGDFANHTAELMTRYRAATNDSLTDEDLDKITSAAEAGAVDSLILTERARPVCGTQVSGRTAQESELQLTSVLDHAVRETLRHGGRVIFLRDSEFPESPAGAIYRYPVKELLPAIEA